MAKENTAQTATRDQIIVRTSIIGILANVLLAAFKTFVGLASHSIAIVLDAVNNISDAGSSVITIIGTKLAGRKADRKHPFGHGRVEYLSAMIIAILVLYAGITSLTESIKKIINPETPDYSGVTLLIVAAGVIVKIFLGKYVKSIGEKVESESLVNSGEDARLDAVISASTLVAAIIYLTTHISLEAILGAVISVMIIKSGIEMLRSTLSEILGERPDAELVKNIKATVCSFPPVSGAYDLILHNYGPGAFNGSVHIEVPDTCTADQLDLLIRQITEAVYRRHGIALTGVGIYSVNTKDPKAIRMREDIYRMVLAHPHVLQAHAFYVDEAEKTIRLDVVFSFSAPDRQALQKEIYDEIHAAYPDYTVSVLADTDFSES